MTIVRWTGWAVVATLMVVLLGGAVRIVTVTSSSMAPTLCPGDRGVFWAWGAGTLAGPDDLVLIDEAAGGKLLVKRVVAAEGQTVEIVDGILVVDGRPRAESYVDEKAVDGTFFGPVTVPGRAVFVLGDEREHSVDSRDFGAVGRERVVGIGAGWSASGSGSGRCRGARG